MKKNIYILVLFFLCSSQIFSQSGWFQQSLPTPKSVNQIFFINDQTGWICAESLKVFKTTNSGDNWNVFQIAQFFNNPPLKSVHFINNMTGWCVGGQYFLGYQMGYKYKTTNGGTTWVDNGANQAAFSFVYFKDNSTGFLAIDDYYDFVHDGKISMTTNSGVNWFYPDIQGYNYGYRKIIFKDSQTGYALGLKWIDVGIDSSIILKTTNGGLNWFASYKKRNFQYKSYFNDISSAGNNVWVVSRYDSILYSSDNGDSWINYYINSLSSLNKLFFVNQYTGWIGKSNINSQDSSNMLKTTNSGLNWFNATNPFGVVSAIFFVNPLTGWCGFPEQRDYICKTISGGITGISTNNFVAVSTFKLHQNYPNPFNPTTKINYSLPTTQYTILKVYDILGNEISTLVNEKQNAGSYSVEFDASDFPSGIYYYKLETDSPREAGNFNKVRKMIFLK